MLSPNYIKVCVLGENTTEVMHPSQCIISRSTWCWYILLLVMLTLLIWLRWCLPDFTSVELASLSGSPLQQLLLWYSNSDFLFLSVYIYYLELFHKEELSLLPPVFPPYVSPFPSFLPFLLSLCQYGYFILWVIIQYFYSFCWSNCFSFVHWELFSGLFLCPLLLMTQGHLYILDFSVL